MASEPFRIGLTRDFLDESGKIRFGAIGLELLDEAPGVVWDYLPENERELSPATIRGYDALWVLGSSVTARTMDGADRLAIVARYGVGFDAVDVDALTRHGVILTITPEGVRRPMATTNLTLLLALAHRLFDQDRLTRSGGWARKHEVMGVGLTGKTLGTIGFGNIAREFLRLAKPLEMRYIAADPFFDAAAGADLGVEQVGLDELLRQADFVVVACSLSPATRGLLSRERIGSMKPTAYVISTARGPIVDQRALYEALRDRRIAGAGMDVYETEPIDPADPLLALDNVIVTPHALGWTDEWAYLSGVSACRAMLDVAAGRVPPNVVNPAAIDTPRFQAKL
ncbi:MAG TPA: NAD(P)-dependent oxidoreductase, partial [Thermomicrobiales bacterium]|nr:NAD(P)-dependent oxidoreductase [Thermomicrobiales bacterium]